MDTFKVFIDVLEIVIIVNPRSLKLLSHSITSSGQILFFGLKNLPMGITFVLSRLADNPEISLKPSIYLTHALRESSEHSIVRVVSSVKVLALISPDLSLSPLIF